MRNQIHTDYKAWVSDFDGTIANPDLVYSDRVKQAIFSLTDRGFYFSIASGRPFYGTIKQACEDMKLTSPQIVSGGSAIVDPKTGEYIWKQPIEQKTSEAIVRFFSEKGYKFGLENESFVFTPGAMVVTGYGPNIQFRDIKSFDFKTTLKMVLFDVNGEDLSEVGVELANSYPDLHLVRSGVRVESSVFDITSTRGIKHLAVLELSKILQIEREKIIGIGDGYNDYPLLTACGFKIAMNNAPEELKEIADLVVSSVGDDGFVEAVNKLFPANLPQ